MAHSAKCPECGFQFELLVVQHDISINCPKCKFSFNTINENVSSPDQQSNEQSVGDLSCLMPEKFLAVDPEFINRGSVSQTEQHVVLPNGKGGLQSVDQHVVTIQHHGKSIELIALPPDQRKKRQRLINFLSIVLGVIFILLFFYWVV